MRLVLLGPPGAGKGTQVRLVAEKVGGPQISTGDILREAISRETALGKMAGVYVDAGNLVPDEIMLLLVKERIENIDCNGGFILDGFPRTRTQARGLEEIMQTSGEELDAAVFIDVDDDVLISRLSSRRICSVCSAPYNLETDPPEVDGICDRCGEKLVVRADDSVETLRTRLRVYQRDTLPVVEYYEAEGILKRICGNGKIDEVFSAILSELKVVGHDEQ